jgi:alpha-1,2-mannosyltransferase
MPVHDGPNGGFGLDFRGRTSSARAAIICRMVESAAGASAPWSEPRGSRARPRISTILLVFFAVSIMLAVIAMSSARGWLAWDVRYAYLPAAEAVLDGDSPYPALDDPILEDQKGYVYTPQLLFALVPFTPLPNGVVGVIVAVGLVALLLLTLRLVEVRDIRCYAAALLWVPSVSGVLLGNLSIPLAFAVAVAWRYRDETWKPAWALGLAISAKFLMWPLLVWTVATRRLRMTAWAVAIGLMATLAAWAAIGFDGLTGYPDLLRRLSDIQSERSYSIVGMASTAGLGEPVGQALTLLAGAALLVGCVVWARRSDDTRSFTCAVVATLVLSPIVWLHYLVVLLVPVALARPRFSLLWLLPVLLWVSPKPGYAEGVQTFAPAIAVAILVAVLLARPTMRPKPA